MTGTNFNFFGNQDPLLGGNNLNECLRSLEALQSEIAQRKQQLVSMQNQPQQDGSRTPVWDEIDKTLADLSDEEFARVAADQSFVESQQVIMNVLQAVQLKMMRPMVEATAEGKKALEEHLQLVKHLKRTVSKETKAEMQDFKEYQEHYSHLTWDEYKAQKMGSSKKGGKR